MKEKLKGFVHEKIRTSIYGKKKKKNSTYFYNLSTLWYFFKDEANFWEKQLIRIKKCLSHPFLAEFLIKNEAITTCLIFFYYYSLSMIIFCRFHSSKGCWSGSLYFKRFRHRTPHFGYISPFPPLLFTYLVKFSTRRTTLTALRIIIQWI